MKKTVVFDFDGTLVDTMHTYTRLASDIICAQDEDLIYADIAEQYRKTSGLSFPEQLTLIVPHLKSRHHTMNQAFHQKKQQLLSQTILSSLTIETLSKLKETGYKVCISSNNEIEIIEEFLKNQSLTFQFDLVLGLSDVHKKGPLHFAYIRNQWAIANEDIIFIGDSLKDAEKALSERISFIGVCGFFSAQEFHSNFDNITTVSELNKISPELIHQVSIR